MRQRLNAFDSGKRCQNKGAKWVFKSAYSLGVPGYYEYILSPVLGPDGSVEEVVGSARVITARKQLEDERERLLAALKNERSRLAAVIEQAPAFMATLRGPEHVIELANEQYYKLIGR